MPVQLLPFFSRCFSARVSQRRRLGRRTGSVEGLEQRALLSAGPRVLGITPANAQWVQDNATWYVKDSATWNVQFSEPVTGVDASDFTLLPQEGLTWTDLQVTGTGDYRMVTVSGLNGTGILRLDLQDDGSIRDYQSLPLYSSNEVSFEAIVDSDQPLFYRQQITGDFDGDGLDEIFCAVADSKEGVSRVVRLDVQADGSIRKSDVPLATSGAQALHLFAGDVTADGKSEVFVGLGAYSDGGLSVFGAQPDGTSTLLSSLPVKYLPEDWTFSPSRSVAFGDFNSDGDMDLAVNSVNNWPSGVQILNGDAAGGFALGQWIPLPGFSFFAKPRTLIATDLNADGRTDLLIEDSTNNEGKLETHVLLGTPQGQLSATTTYIGRDFGFAAGGLFDMNLIGRDIELGAGGIFDMDGDLRADWIGSDSVLGLCVFPGNGDGTFGAPSAIGYSGSDRITVQPSEIVILPAADGLSSLLLLSLVKDPDTGNVLNRTKVTLFDQTVSGHYELASQLEVDGSLFPGQQTKLQSRAGGQHGLELRVSVVDTAVNTASTVFYRLEISANQQLTAVPLPLSIPGAFVNSVDGDFDGDGISDTAIVTANASDLSQGTDLRILLRNATVAGTDPVRTTTTLAEPPGNNPTCVIPALIDSDAFMDVLSVSPSTNTLNYHRALGDGRFAAPETISVGATPQSVTTLDFNFDGFTDVITANSGSDSISVLTGTASGSLVRQSDIVVGQSPRVVLSADFNQDERMDLLVTLPGDFAVNILYGTAEGTLAAATPIGLDLPPEFATVADFNGDSFPDVAVSGPNATFVHILLGSADGLQYAPVVGLTTTVRQLLTEDIDQDGRFDLLISTGNGQLLACHQDNVGTLGDPERIAGYDPSPQVSIATGDLNGFQPDLISLHRSWLGNSIGLIGILTDRLDNLFAPSIGIPVDHNPQAFFVADVTGDQRNDLVLADGPKANLRVFRNTGNGALLGTAVTVVTNLPPTCDPISTTIEILEDTPVFKVPVTGISAGIGEEQLVRIVPWFSSNPDILPLPQFVIHPDQTSGEIILKPVRARSGTVNISYYIEDSGDDGNFETTEDNGYYFFFQQLDVIIKPIRPIVVSPVGAIQQQRPTFTWIQVPDAAYYRVWITNNSASRDPLILILGLSTYQPEQDLGIGRYDVWVQAVKGNGQRLPWSLKHSFEITTAVLLPKPASRLATARPEFTWPAISGADAYEIYLTNVSTGQAGAIQQIVTTNSWKPETDLSMSNWRIWGRALIRGRYAASWSGARDFTITTPPTPITPLVFSTQQRPEFQWSAVSGATQYGFQLRSAATGKIVHDVRGLTSPAFTPPADLPFGRYRWWSFAESTASGIRGDWSVAAELVISDRPVLQSPVGTVPAQNPLLKWMAFPGAVTYEVWVNRSQPSQYIVSAAGLNSTEWQVPVTLTPGIKHRYWVRAVTTNGQTTQWSQPLEFRIEIAQSVPAAEIVPDTAYEPGIQLRLLPTHPDRSRFATDNNPAVKPDVNAVSQPVLAACPTAVTVPAAATADKADSETPAEIALRDEAILLAVAALDGQS